ncbi:uncharacterized protein LOC128222405 [Mya arenaria]|uniref:uncharacterized protein LOC128222405 n=1 Tax=Mya arenaria TaxID=6604 RepID=UPI0022E7E734|nr:uncharacterized protein LOC128222405 [Mya arenaria]
MNQSSEHFCLHNPDQDKEVRPDVTCMATRSMEGHSSLDPKYLQKFSSFRRLTKTVSNLQHVCKSLNKSCECVGWHLCPEASSAENVESAQCLIFRTFQKESYPKEIDCLKEGIPIPASSPLLSLNPFLDEKGVLRVGGRLRNSKLPTPERNPIIVHGRSYLALLLIRHFHEKVLHQGRHFTEGAVREGGFWVTGGKKQVSSYIYSCVLCRKLRSKSQTQLMADLPADRLTPAPPFTYVGVDVFGPWNVVTRKTRGGQSTNKRWAVLFTCLTIRAVHVELVEEMSSSAFINALRRFISIRGNVLQFRSDRGTNFVGATSDLGVDAVNIEDQRVKGLLEEKGTTWVFNPPHASHMGGVWERMIGVVRRALDSILTGHKLQNLTHDVLATLMAEVCAIVNARPLVPVSHDAEAPEILSPSMLLTQKSSSPISFNENLSIKDIYRAEWKRVQVLADQFWARWKSEFLNMLQNRQKWVTSKPNLKVGDVVLLKDSSTTRNQWPLAVVVEVYFSTDEKVRTVQVRSVSDGKSSLFVRPITKLVLLLSE